MGWKRDLKARQTSKRQDNSAWRKTIDSARALVHEKNYAINSVAVEKFVAESSFVPTRVGLYNFFDPTTLSNIAIECIFSSTFRFKVQPL
jgi:hypothetical protein